MRPLRDESGFVGGLEVLPFGFLVFVAGTLLLVNAWAVFDGHLAASSAAREAVRAYVESVTDERAAADAGDAAAREAIEGHGKDVGRMTLTWSTVGLRRCEPVTVSVAYRVPLVAIPWLGVLGHGITTTARHTEVVDPYRGGLAVDDFDPGSCGA